MIVINIFTSASVSAMGTFPKSSKLVSRLALSTTPVGSSFLLSSWICGAGAGAGAGAGGCAVFQLPVNLSFRADNFIDNKLLLLLLSEYSMIGTTTAGSVAAVGSVPLLGCCPLGTDSSVESAVAESRPDSTRPGTKASRAKMEVLSGLTGEWKNRTFFCNSNSLKSRTVLCWNLWSRSRIGSPGKTNSR